MNVNKRTNHILRKKEIRGLYGLSITTINNRIKEGLLPPPVNLGGRAVGFISKEVQVVISAMALELPKDKILELVVQIIENRKKVFRDFTESLGDLNE